MHCFKCSNKNKPRNNASGFVFTVDVDKYLHNKYNQYNKTYYKDSRFAD